MNWWLAAALLLGRGVSAQENDSRANPRLIQPGGLFLFYSVQGPLSFVTPTFGELPKGAQDGGEVRGRSCQHGLSVPLTASLNATSISGAAGNGGYQKALAGILKARPELAGIYDVKVDVQLFSILGFYRRLCTEVLARGFRLGS